MLNVGSLHLITLYSSSNLIWPKIWHTLYDQLLILFIPLLYLIFYQNTFEFGPDVKLPRKMIICVESIRMLYNYTDLVLWYEYPHLSSSRYNDYTDLVLWYEYPHLSRSRYNDYTDLVLWYEYPHLSSSRYNDYTDPVLWCLPPGKNVIAAKHCIFYGEIISLM